MASAEVQQGKNDEEMKKLEHQKGKWFLFVKPPARAALT